MRRKKNKRYIDIRFKVVLVYMLLLLMSASLKSDRWECEIGSHYSAFSSWIYYVRLKSMQRWYCSSGERSKVMFVLYFVRLEMVLHIHCYLQIQKKTHFLCVLFIQCSYKIKYLSFIFEIKDHTEKYVEILPITLFTAD